MQIIKMRRLVAAVGAARDAVNEGNRTGREKSGPREGHRSPNTVVPGFQATRFVTVNLAERRGNRLLVERIDVLRTAFRSVRARHPFYLATVVILRDHWHCVWTLALVIRIILPAGV